MHESAAPILSIQLYIYSRSLITATSITTYCDLSNTVIFFQVHFRVKYISITVIFFGKKFDYCDFIWKITIIEDPLYIARFICNTVISEGSL